MTRKRRRRRAQPILPRLAIYMAAMVVAVLVGVLIGWAA